jgi:hypothetical protein
VIKKILDEIENINYEDMWEYKEEMEGIYIKALKSGSKTDLFKATQALEKAEFLLEICGSFLNDAMEEEIE